MSIDLSKGIEVESFTKIYGGSKGRVACSDVNFSAGASRVVGILGPNGAGKSSLLKARCGFHYPTSGKISVCGTSDPNEIRRITGYVPEFPELDKKLTVTETLYLEARLRGLSETEIKRNIEKALSLAELEDVAWQKVGTLSKGYTQRASFAKAICFDPMVLVLDEFSGGLDPAQTVKMRRTVKKLSEKKIVIQSTHRIEEAEQLCDFIYVMDRGKMVARGTINEIVAGSGKKNLEEAFISLTQGKTGGES